MCCCDVCGVIVVCEVFAFCVGVCWVCVVLVWCVVWVRWRGVLRVCVGLVCVDVCVRVALLCVGVFVLL